MIIEYKLKRLENVNGKPNFSWGMVTNKIFQNTLISWNHDWLLRETYKLKIGEEKIYYVDTQSYRILNNGDDDKVLNYFIETYIWFLNLDFYLARLIRLIKTKIDYWLLPKSEKERVKHMWDGVQIVRETVTTIPSELVEVRPLSPPTAKVMFFDFKRQNNFLILNK